MKLTSAFIPLSLSLSVHSLPILGSFFESFYRRDDASQLANELTSFVDGSNATNGTTGGSGSGSEVSVQIYGFSENFTELFNNEVTFDNSDISSLIPNSSNSSSSPPLKEVLKQSFPNVTLDFELLNNTDSSNFSSSNLIQIYKGIVENFESHEAFIVLPDLNHIESTAFFIEAVLPSNVTSEVIFVPDVNSRNIASGGFQNLRDAVLVASSNSTPEDLNTLIVQDQYVYSGFFSTSEIADFSDDEVEWFFEIVKPLNISSGLEGSTLPEDFANANIDESLPLVVVLDINQNNLILLDTLAQLNIQGLVLSAHSIDSSNDSLQKAISNLDIPIVIASDSSSVSREDIPDGAISAGILDSENAKVLLQAGLAAGYDQNKLKQLFTSVYGG